MEQEAKSHSPRIIGLDIARAVAILCVLMAHLSGHWFDTHPAARLLFGNYGFTGVELFFVLSGFLIGGILLRQAQSAPFQPRHIPHFWIRRWFRTLPNYYLFLILFTLVTPPLIWSRWLLYPFFLQNLYGFNSDNTFFNISWSLCVEEWMYLLLPIILVLFTRLTRDTQKAAISTIAF